MRCVRSVCLVLGVWGAVVWLLVGCQTRIPRPESVPFHTLYEPIDSPEAKAFVERGIAYLQREYGALEFPVREVLLRYSRTNVKGRGYEVAQHFSLTEIVNAQAGVFAIYIAVPPGDEEFYPLLAHEIGHLKQPSLKEDWAMEGFCMVFSEELCAREGKDWSVWTRRFAEDPSDPYARAYQRALLK